MAHVFFRAVFFILIYRRVVRLLAQEKFPPNLDFPTPSWLPCPYLVVVCKLYPVNNGYGDCKQPHGNAGQKRKTKDLPECLLYLNDRNVRTKVQARLETDSKEIVGEVMVAYAMLLEDESAESAFDLNSLTLDQIRKLCKNVGVQYVNKCTKFQCRKALWILSGYHWLRRLTK